MYQHSDDDRRSNRPGGGLVQLSQYAQRRAVLAEPQRISELGARRLRRNRAGQAAMGTGAVAAVVLLGLGLTANVSNHGRSVSTAASATHATSSFFPWKRVSMMTDVTRAKASSWVPALWDMGFKQVTVVNVHSATVPKGNIVDIEDSAHRSVGGKVISTDTPLIVLVSTGPAH